MVRENLPLLVGHRYRDRESIPGQIPQKVVRGKDLSSTQGQSELIAQYLF